jgi:hypothetical protein
MSDTDPDRTGSAFTSAATLVSHDFPIVGGRPACLTAIPIMAYSASWNRSPSNC